MLDRSPAARRWILALSLVCLAVACKKEGPVDKPAEGPAGSADGGPAGLPAKGPADAPPAPATPVDLSGWNLLSGSAGVFELAWRTATGGMPRNQDFQLELLLRKAGTLVPGAHISVSGWMPDHGHGMVRAPIVTERDAGHYEVEGMLLHMRGRWDLTFEIAADGLTDTVLYTVEL